jgi:hypothetical protein
MEKVESRLRIQESQIQLILDLLKKTTDESTVYEGPTVELPMKAYTEFLEIENLLESKEFKKWLVGTNYFNV